MASRRRTFNERVTYLAGVKARARRKLADELIGDSYCFTIPDHRANQVALKKELSKLKDHLAKEKQKKKAAREKTHARGTVKRARRSSQDSVRPPSTPANKPEREDRSGCSAGTSITGGDQ